MRKLIQHVHRIQRTPRVVALAMVLTLVSALATNTPVPAAAPSAPLSKAAMIHAAAPMADVLPAATCPVVSGTLTCDLWAATGTLSLPGAVTVNIWGYSSTSGGPATLPGPTLIVTQGMPVNINLHNVNLPSATSLSISQQPIMPDTTGVTAGNSKTYAIGAATLKPGTFLYEAGLTADGARQVAMGLFGALIVRPAAGGTAYGSPATAFNDEAVLVLSEIDPALNAAPLTFDMSEYNPTFWLINGKAYPDVDTPTPLINTSPGNSLLLRYVNAGLKPHSMSLLGLHQSIIATDGNPYANPIALVAQTIPTGETIDTIVSIAPTVPAGTKYALYDAGMHMDNNGVLASPPAPNPAYTQIVFGGMLTFVTVTGTVTLNGGPVTSNVVITPNPTNGSAGATLTASINAVTGTVSAAEYFVDSIGADGTGTAMSGAFGGASASVSASLSAAALAALSSGNHTFYVHGQDSTGQWGKVASVVLNLDKTGPAIINVGLTPSVTNGSVNLNLQATANDASTGNQAVIAAEYFIDPVGTPAGGTGTAITLPFTATAVNLNATIISPTVAALSQGPHTVAIRAEDALGNWGAFGTIALTVDKTGPTTSNAMAVPNPTNGTIGLFVGSLNQFFQVFSATVSDPVAGSVNSNIKGAEFFVDTVTANGTGNLMIATDGAFNQTTEGVYQAVPLQT